MTKKHEREARRLRGSAYHEAGHAVVACLGRMDLVSTTISPDDGSRGLTVTGRELRHVPGVVMQGSHWIAPDWPIQDDVIQTQAGKAAGQLVEKRYNHRDSVADQLHIDEIAQKQWKYLGGREWKSIVEELWVETVRFVHLPDVRRCIVAVAEALQARETLQGAEVEAIIDSTLGGRPWPELPILEPWQRPKIIS